MGFPDYKYENPAKIFPTQQLSCAEPGMPSVISKTVILIDQE
jgi:hypothetical protein